MSSSAERRNERSALWRAVFGAPARVVAIARNNPQAIDLARQVVLEPARRGDALVGGVSLLLGKLFAAEIQAAETKAKGFAHTLLASEAWRTSGLQETLHFGALESLSLLKLTRADYVMLVVAELLHFKQVHVHLGLGSDSGIRIGDNSLSNLELAQSWVILLNLGHLFGTFATERGLAFHLADDVVARREFLNGIDSSIRPYFERTIERPDLLRIHYATAAWRVSNWKPNATRTTALQCIGAYMDETRPRDALRWAFRRARQLVYNRLHSFGTPGSVMHTQAPSFLRSLLSPGALLIHPHSDEDNSIMHLLDSIDRFAHRTFFASPTAAAIVLTHVREFREWWRLHQTAGTSVPERIARLFTRPPDWPTRVRGELSHFARVELPDQGNDWISAVRQWNAGGAAWDRWHFLVSSVPDDPTEAALVCDIYWDGAASVGALRQCGEMLGDHGAQSWTMDDRSARRLWRGFARFGARLFDAVLREGYHLVVRPVPAAEEHYGYAICAPNAGRAKARLVDFLDSIEEPQRERELRAVAAWLDANPSPDPCLVFLGECTVFSADSGQKAKELDGLVATFRADGVAWTAIEHKSAAGAGGGGQLLALAALTCVPLSAPQPFATSAGVACSVTFLWPEASSARPPEAGG